jgi:hypothetical protein
VRSLEREAAPLAEDLEGEVAAADGGRLALEVVDAEVFDAHLHALVFARGADVELREVGQEVEDEAAA